MIAIFMKCVPSVQFSLSQGMTPNLQRWVPEVSISLMDGQTSGPNKTRVFFPEFGDET